MTALYQKHASVALKREKLQQMPDFMGLLEGSKTSKQMDKTEKLRTKIKKIIDVLTCNNDFLSYILC